MVGAHQGHYPEEEEDEDDITEIREGEDSSDYYDNYEQNYDEHGGGYDEDDITEIREGEDSSDYYDNYEQNYDEHGGSYEEEAVQGEEALPTAGAPPAGPQLMGLLCPKCCTMCQGVQALKEHMQVCQGAPPRGSNQGASGSHHAAEEEPQVCQICDKSFKSHRTLDNHMKKQHGLAGTPKGRGRPKKGGVPGWGHGDGSTEYQTMSESTSKGRPVGQVAPAQRSTDAPGGGGSKQAEGGKGTRDSGGQPGGEGR